MKQELKKTVKRISVFLAIVIFTAPGSAAAAQADAKTEGAGEVGPRIAFDRLEHDFGEVVQNTSPKHTFTFKNTGKRELVIEKVKAG